MKNFMILSVAAMMAALAVSCQKAEPLAETDAANAAVTRAYNMTPKITIYVETNDVNPLNAGDYLLSDGTPYASIVELFASNIHKEIVGGIVRPTLYLNDKMTNLLENGGTEKYIKPLQDRGIKVVLGILGNHDISGISTLKPELAKEFAAEVKNLCDAYELDGIFLDDEYTDYEGAGSTTIPGFTAPSVEAASRMAYEIRKAQPSRLLISYRYEALYDAVAVDGMEPGQIFDYVVNDYWQTSNPCDTYPGLENQPGRYRLMELLGLLAVHTLEHQLDRQILA